MQIFLFFSILSFFPIFYSAEATPPPFEKIYVSPYDILSTPEGCFYQSPETGEYEPVRAILRDGEGTYVLKIVQQCPVCGKCYFGKAPSEGYSCPLWQIEALPHIWVNP